MSRNLTSPCPSDSCSDTVKRVPSTSVNFSMVFPATSSQMAATAKSSQTAATPVSQTPAMPLAQTVATPLSNSFVASPRIPHTHTSLAIIKMLKNLPLISILHMNKEIEDKNTLRSQKTLITSLILLFTVNLDLMRPPWFLSMKLT